MSERSCETLPCGISVPIDTLKKALFIRNKSTGCMYLNVSIKQITAEDCEDYEPAVECGVEQNYEMLLQQSITIDACENPVLQLITVSE